MVTLAIAAITLSIGVPSFTSFIQNNRISTQTNDFITSLNLTRSEAIKRGTPVKICRSADGNSCGDDTINWHDGWMIFTDNNGDDDLDDDETLIRVHGALNTPDTTLDGNFFFGTSVVFDSNGGSSVMGSFLLCDKRGVRNNARAIVITSNGRVRSIKPTGDANSPPAVRTAYNTGTSGTCIF